jgi:hypothetical protein
MFEFFSYSFVKIFSASAADKHEGHSPVFAKASGLQFHQLLTKLKF